MATTGNFDKLSKEKQTLILNAAYACFGRDGYKKTAMSEIAKEACISKAAIFHYFGTKDDLYRYIFNYARGEILAEIVDGTDDFFECLQLSTQAKMRVMTKYPGMYGFLLSVATESSSALLVGSREDIYSEMERGSIRLFANVDWARFKPEYDRTTIMNLVGWVSNGCIRQFADSRTADEIVAEVDRSMTILKQALYKQRFL